MRAVLDPNVLISALLSRDGPPAKLLRAWQDGRFDLVVSAELIAELERALAYPKLRDRINAAQASAFIELLSNHVTRAPDSDAASAIRSTDAGDDYLIGLAESADAVLVSGDAHLLDLGGKAPILSPRQCLDQLESADR